MNIFPRVIPVLTISDGYVVKPVKFKGERYIGDPINAVRIFNEKQVDELIICDIDSTPKSTGINFSLIEDIASEAFMPLSYGGGVKNVEEAKRIAEIGIEKILLNTSAFANPSLITALSETLGSSSTVVSIDSKKRITGGWDAFVNRGSRRTGLSAIEAASRAQEYGAGEIVVSSIDREGTRNGYDLGLIQQISTGVNIPVVALGGAGSFRDFRPALDSGASAVAAGTMFVLNGKHEAVLISYPGPAELRTLG